MGTATVIDFGLWGACERCGRVIDLRHALIHALDYHPEVVVEAVLEILAAFEEDR